VNQQLLAWCQVPKPLLRPLLLCACAVGIFQHSACAFLSGDSQGAHAAARPRQAMERNDLATAGGIQTALTSSVWDEHGQWLVSRSTHAPPRAPRGLALVCVLAAIRDVWVGVHCICSSAAKRREPPCEAAVALTAGDGECGGRGRRGAARQQATKRLIDSKKKALGQ
jgi:hypothetical protein